MSIVKKKMRLLATVKSGRSLAAGSPTLFTAGGARLLKIFRAALFLAGLLIAGNAFGAFESATTADSPFYVDSSTAAVVSSYSALIGDEYFPSTSATVYNLFGANNATTEAGTGDVIFADKNASPDTVSFSTPTPVTLTGVALYLDSDDGTLDGPRSIGTFRFSANGTPISMIAESMPATVDPAPYNESIADNFGQNIFMFTQTVTASTFVATFSTNPNLNFTPDGNNDGVGPRVYELDGLVPEPSSFGILACAALGILSRRRPHRFANS